MSILREVTPKQVDEYTVTSNKDLILLAEFTG
jgi:hypothetical protein